MSAMIKREDAYQLIRELINQLEDETLTEISVPRYMLENPADPLAFRSNCFSVDCASDKNNERYNKWLNQRYERGFDDTELWNLDATIARFVKPRLEVFKTIKHGCPGAYETEEAWNADIDKMIYAMDFVINGEDPCDVIDGKLTETENYKKYKEGIELFAKNFMGLWY